MALSDSERDYFKQQSAAGVPAAQIAEAIKAKRGDSGSAPASRPRRGDELSQPDPSPAPLASTASSAPSPGLKVSPEGLVGPDPGQYGKESDSPTLAAIGNTILHPIDTLTDPSKRRELERGVSNATTFGLAQRLGEKADPSFAATAAPDSTAAPGYQGAGEAAGMLMPSLAGKAIEGGVKTVIGGAPERVGARILSNIGRGEAGGTAKAKAVGNMLTKAGPDGEKLLSVVEDAGLTDSLATKAAARPAAALKDVQRVLDHNEEKVLGPVYKAIDKAGTGPDSTRVGVSLLDKANELRAAGKPEVAEAVERYTKFLDRNYGKDTQFSGTMIRKLKGGIGEGAFENLADATTPLGQQVKREIYGVYAKAVEDAAVKTPGVDLQALRTGNERASQLLGVSEVLADRATKAKAGASTLSNAIATGGHKAALAGLIGHAILKGDVSEISAILATEGGYQLVKRIPQMLRHVDLAASKAERAVRAGDIGAQIAKELLERAAATGVGTAVGERINQPDEEATP